MSQSFPKVKYSLGNTDLENPTPSFSITSAFENNFDNLHNIRTKKYIGRNIPLLWRGAEPLLTIGPDWGYFLCMWIFLVLIGIVVIFFVAREQSFTVYALSIGITAWEAFIYLYTALKNPGILSAYNLDEQQLKQNQEDPEYCAVCKIVRSDDVEHCEDCDVCIKGFDHHCPWTGKCIGVGNLVPFYTFITSTVVYMVVFILILFNAL